MSGQSSWLIQTKLRPPQLCSDAVPRPHLLEALHNGLTSRRLTLLSAPAGYGKTTLLALLPITHPDLPLAWLALDEGENDPALFLAYLTAALQHLNPACCTTVQALLDDLLDPGAQARRVVGALVNDVLETLPFPFALVLDDLHLVTEPAVYAALDYLLERLPPQMHLAVGTRHDPPLSLARLRARGQLAELRVPDLRFTLEEAAAFFNQQLRLGLSADDLTILQARTEGWVAGLCLLAGSLDRISTPNERTAFINHLAQTNRHVFDFLADEVLNRQSEAVKTFLLETAILTELTPALCQAVTGRSDARALLENLDRRDLFVVAVDKARTTFRYHDLFAEFLRQRLGQEMPERVVELYRRAAEAQSLPERAISHYLAAEMWVEAADIIEQVGEELVYRGLLDTLVGWIGALSGSVREKRPQLSFLLGLCNSIRGDTATTQLHLEQALAGFEASGDEARQGEVLTHLASCALMQADFARSIELGDRALTYPVAANIRVGLLMERAWLATLSGDLARAQADFERALQVTQETDAPDTFRELAGGLSPTFAILPDGLEHLERIANQAVARFKDQVGPLHVLSEGQLAFVHLWRGRLEQAIQFGENALAMSERLSIHLSMMVDITATAALAHVARGDYGAADRLFALMFDRAEWLGIEKVFEVGLLYLLGRTRWLQGRLKEARQVYDRMEAASGFFELPYASVLRLLMRGLLAMPGSQTGPEWDQRIAEAESLFRKAVVMEQKSHLSILFGSARLMLAHVYLERSRPQDALAELGPVLAECERQNTPGRILKEGGIVVPLLRLAVAQDVHAAFAVRLLDILNVADEPQPVRVPDTGETLTRREIEVLRLVATGSTNRAIAEQLVISQHTVKTHVVHILRKLDVSSRTQAAARARELGIAPRLADDDVV